MCDLTEVKKKGKSFKIRAPVIVINIIVVAVWSVISVERFLESVRFCHGRKSE